MSRRRPTTIHLDADVERAIRRKVAVSGKSVPDLVNEGLRRLLREDLEDLRLFNSRSKGKTRPYEEFVAELRKNGEI